MPNIFHFIYFVLVELVLEWFQRVGHFGANSFADGEQLVVVVFEDGSVADGDVRDAVPHAYPVQAAAMQGFG